MDALKWLVTVSLMLAFMFLGIKQSPKHDKQKDKNSVGVSVGKLFIR